MVPCVAGTTLSKLLPYLEGLGPSSVRVATLLEKRVEKRTYRDNLHLDFVGFSIPDTFIVVRGACIARVLCGREKRRIP